MNNRHFIYRKLQVYVDNTAQDMADHAAGVVAGRMRTLLETKPELNVVVSGALSQQLFHRALAAQPGVAWNNVNAFAVDDFWAPGMDPRFTVAQQPARDLYASVHLKTINTLRFDAPDPEAERRRYEALIAQHPADIALLGIGISGHIAFNEPGQTDFHDPQKVRVITVVEESKQQLMNDPNFRTLGSIPERGITITVAELMRCPNVFVIVPYREKAPIVRRLLTSHEVSADFPASILMEKDGAMLFLDAESYALCACMIGEPGGETPWPHL
jgi:glucosamine-6-phosphate deaminase